MSDGVYGAPFALYLGIDNHEVLQASLHVLLVVAQSSLLLLDLLLYLLSLVLQRLHGGLFGAFLACFALVSAFLGHCGLLCRWLLGTFLLCIGSQGKGQ